jgi:rRNA processing protein Gar1
MATTNIPQLGARVVTSDGEQLGKIKEISGDCFQIDAPLQTDYWLASDTISSTLAGEILLNFTRDNLGREKAEGKEHHGVHRHT